MKIKQDREELYNQYREESHAVYGRYIFKFAERWASLMEAAIESGDEVCVIADTTADQADTDGITGNMFSLAVHMLAGVWEYGEELRLWYNARHGYSGEGIVNPAVLHVTL